MKALQPRTFTELFDSCAKTSRKGKYLVGWIITWCNRSSFIFIFTGKCESVTLVEFLISLQTYHTHEFYNYASQFLMNINTEGSMGRQSKLPPVFNFHMLIYVATCYVPSVPMKGGSYLMRADLAASSRWGAGQEGWLEEDGGRVEEDDGFFLFRRTCRDLTLVGWTGPRLLRRRATLRTGAVSDLWKGWSHLETQFERSVSATSYWLKWVTCFIY